ncbi:MAG: M67 family metallopeptidase [Thermoleophilaceae bacterium]|nr:M67 family metallopeptidase [Thermoleophilaceae bacterium]
MRLSETQRDELLTHARETSPEECCGYGRMRDGRVEELVRARNAYASPRYGFELDFQTLVALNDLDDEGHGIVVYHSHPRSPAEPSQMDRNAAQYPHWLYVIVSPLEESIRAWWLRGGEVEEEPVEVA